MFVNVNDCYDDMWTIEFDFDLTEDLVREFLNIYEEYGEFESHSLEDWEKILSDDVNFSEFIGEVFESEIEARCNDKHFPRQ